MHVYAQQQVGASVTASRDKAYAECKATVERLAAHCRAKNRRFRDIEFDIENDRDLCLDNLGDKGRFKPSDVRRVTSIFDKPVFYSGTARSTEVTSMDEVIGDYLIAALTTLPSMPGLVEKLCVARDEAVGIYGFIFHRDCYWVPVIVDDLLFTRVPKYEQLSYDEQELYHFDKDKYNLRARRGGDSLYFSRPVRVSKDKDTPAKDGNDKEGSASGKTATDEGETWIPLLEKAYAKLHGDYASIWWGCTNDVLEDLTGGCSTITHTKDILDPDVFWRDELVHANKDRLFGCWFQRLDATRTGNQNQDLTVNGLRSDSAYSIIKAVEIKGKRFVVLRDPFGQGSWEGPWSDGSKQWTSEWLKVLPELGHTFGKNGQFVMEYEDFLDVWQEVQRTRIFDDSWVVSSQWLWLSPPCPKTDAFSFGDISFTFTLPKASPTTIVLARYTNKYFYYLRGPCIWNLDFVVARLGESQPIAESSYASFHDKSISLELDLQPGTYVVLARLDPEINRAKDYIRTNINNWNRRKLARTLTEKAKSQSIAANFKPNPEYIPTSVQTLLNSEQASGSKAISEALHSYGSVKPGESITVTTTTTTTTVVSKSASTSTHPQTHGQVRFTSPTSYGHGGYPATQGAPSMQPEWGSHAAPTNVPTTPGPESVNFGYTGTLHPQPGDMGYAGGAQEAAPMFDSLTVPFEDDVSVVVGLRVFTKKDALTVITGRVKPAMLVPPVASPPMQMGPG